MADNRLYLHCTSCGEDIAIARISAGDANWTPARTPEAEFAAFLVKHQHCSQEDDRLHIALSSECADRVVITTSSLLERAMYDSLAAVARCIVQGCLYTAKPDRCDYCGKPREPQTPIRGRSPLSAPVGILSHHCDHEWHSEDSEQFQQSCAKCGVQKPA